MAPALWASSVWESEGFDDAHRRATALRAEQFYGRYANPTVRSFEEVIAELEGAVHDAQLGQFEDASIRIDFERGQFLQAIGKIQVAVGIIRAPLSPAILGFVADADERENVFGHVLGHFPIGHALPVVVGVRTRTRAHAIVSIPVAAASALAELRECDPDSPGHKACCQGELPAGSERMDHPTKLRKRCGHAKVKDQIDAPVEYPAARLSTPSRRKHRRRRFFSE